MTHRQQKKLLRNKLKEFESGLKLMEPEDTINDIEVIVRVIDCYILKYKGLRQEEGNLLINKVIENQL